ncbi:hypothetical protein GCM10027046_05310 [Uliginosibacterium flavum]|uniref:Uncharacterized protein n=1 Tax=Uliginosibacterium flavum TaxID=1396831 RepID=A0ABV2TJ07_9RHOO
MISIPSVQQTAFASLTAISPVSVQGVSATAGTISAALVDSASTVVQLSATGQVLSAGSLLNNSIQTLQSATPASLVSTTQDFVAAFNQTQTAIASALPLLGSQSGATLIKQLSQTLNAAATSLGENTNLQSIGVSAQTSVVPATAQTTVTLNIDLAALTAAATANPAATQTRLIQSTRSLLQQVASFEAVAASTNGLANDGTTGAVGIPTSLLQNLSADTLANAVQLSDLDLAGLGLDANTLQSASPDLYESLTAAVSTATTTNSAQNQTGASTLATTTSTASIAPTNATAPATTTPAVAAPTLVTATPAGTPAALNQTAPAGTLAQQNLLNNEAQRIINNNATNPFYSAVIATYHLSDGATPRPVTQPLTEPIPAPVLAVRSVQAIKEREETTA